MKRSLAHYKYERNFMKCDKCKWTGYGSAALQGDTTDTYLYLDCPNCDQENIAAVILPTYDDVEHYSTEENVEAVRKRKRFIKKLEEGSIKSSDQLPDNDSEYICLVWDLVSGDDTCAFYNVVTQINSSIVVWKQPASYENYQQFELFCRLAQKKYGSRLFDVIPTRSSLTYLYGGKNRADERIKSIRYSLYQPHL